MLIDVTHISFCLFLALLKIKPAPNNGTFGSLHGLLMSDEVPSLSKPSGDGNNFRTDICKFPSDKVFAERSKPTICSYCKVRCVGNLNMAKI